MHKTIVLATGYMHAGTCVINFILSGAVWEWLTAIPTSDHQLTHLVCYLLNKTYTQDPVNNYGNTVLDSMVRKLSCGGK